MNYKMSGIDFEEMGLGPLAKVLGSAKIGICIFDTHGDILKIDKVLLDLLELERFSSPDMVKGQKLADILPTAPIVRQLLGARADELDGRVFEFPYKTQRGTVKKLRQHIVVRHTQQASQPAFCLFTMDVSDQTDTSHPRVFDGYDHPTSSKWDALKRVTGKAAHDMNNLLAAIKGYADVIMLDLHESDPMRADIEGIGEATAHAYDITNKLLLFSRKQSATLKRLNINLVLRASQAMLSRILGPSIELVFRLDEKLGDVEIDTQQLDLVVRNVVSNAAEAMPQGGKLIIETCNMDFTDADSAADSGISPGYYAIVSFTDTGAGIDERLHERVFEPFFSTRERGRGSGLGLCVVRGIIQHGGGNVHVDSANGHGCSFKISLPLVERPEDSSTQTAPPSPRKDVGASVLVVDDDDLLRSIVKRMLSRSGYEVHVASTSRQALQLCKDEHARIDLALLDIVMPDMNGQDLSARIRTLRPEVKILYMSGFSKESLAEQGVLEEDAELIRKPFPADQLSARILALLSS